MKRQVREWLSFAEIDLLTARKLLDEELLTRSTAFHCHQAAEKALKAVIEDCGVRIPKIHDLKRLMSVIEEKGIRLRITSEELDPLNSVYIDTRYPTDQGLVPNGAPSVETVRQFHAIAERLCCRIRGVLGEPGTTPDGSTAAHVRSEPTDPPEEAPSSPPNCRRLRGDDVRQGP